MEEESNPIKEYLFEYLEKTQENIQKLISEEKFSEIIETVILDCYDKVSGFGEKSEVYGVLATGLLHFLLTNSLITSQRKVMYNGIEIDVVIPDLKTLEKDPKKTLIICIPKTNDKKLIQQKIQQLETIQPEKQNIWMILSEKQDFENKTYIINKENNTFSKIIFDIANFVNIQGQNKFKILRV